MHSYLFFFVFSTGSGKLAVFGVEERGRLGSGDHTLSAHGCAVTDFMFSPFFHDKLFTASEDRTVNKCTKYKKENVSKRIFFTRGCAPRSFS